MSLIEAFMTAIDPAYDFKFVCIAVVNDQIIVKERVYEIQEVPILKFHYSFPYLFTI